MIRLIASSIPTLFRPSLLAFAFCAKKPIDKSQLITLSFTDKSTEEDKDKPITNGTLADIQVDHGRLASWG